MTLKELTEWMAFYELEPWGDSLHGLRSAVNTAAVMNAGLMSSNPKRLRTKPFNPKDFWIGVNSGQNIPKKLGWEHMRKRFNSNIPRLKRI